MMQHMSQRCDTGGDVYWQVHYRDSSGRTRPGITGTQEECEAHARSYAADAADAYCSERELQGQDILSLLVP